jgi:predicted nucleic-acid-binding Zn-ribbon protein
MIMRDIPGTVKCPECGSENIEMKWSLTTIVGWMGRILGVPTVRIYEKKCVECGEEFKVFRK